LRSNVVSITSVVPPEPFEDPEPQAATLNASTAAAVAATRRRVDTGPIMYTSMQACQRARLIAPLNGLWL
jgi:hypothetical protein